jgi:hypothetical protein
MPINNYARPTAKVGISTYFIQPAYYVTATKSKPSLTGVSRSLTGFALTDHDRVYLRAYILIHTHE